MKDNIIRVLITRDNNEDGLICIWYYEDDYEMESEGGYFCTVATSNLEDSVEYLLKEGDYIELNQWEFKQQFGFTSRKGRKKIYWLDKNSNILYKYDHFDKVGPNSLVLKDNVVINNFETQIPEFPFDKIEKAEDGDIISVPLESVGEFHDFPMPKPMVEVWKDTSTLEATPCPSTELAIVKRKQSNPKQAFADKKVNLGVLPWGALYQVAIAMSEGALKYGSHNYREVGGRASTYFGSSIGHLTAWWEGEDIDEESGLLHLVKEISSSLVLLDSILNGNWTDDRPVRYKNDVPMRNNSQMEKLLEKYPNPVKPFTEKEID